MAGKALGWYASLAPSAAFFPAAATYVPVTENLAKYDRLYSVFAGLYPVLREAFTALAGN